MQKIFSLLIISLLLISNCKQGDKKTKQNNEQNVFERKIIKVFKEKIALHTYLQITLYTRLNQSEAEKIIDLCFQEADRIENKYSPTYQNSFLYKLNEKKKLEADQETIYLINNAISYAERTDGLFDVTIYPIVELYGFMTGNYKVPTKTDIANTLPYINYKEIKINNNIVSIPEGFKLDFGGLIKGYAVDKMIELIATNTEITAALVNAGGNIRAFGNKPDGEPWYIGIKHPRKKGEIYKTIEIKGDFAIATAGDYERVFFVNNIRYHHIFNPKTGRPAWNGTAGVTVVTPRAEDADILSTAMFVMGIGPAIRFANENKIKAFIIEEIIVSNQIFLSNTNSIYWDYGK